MRNELQRHKKSDSVKWVLTAVAFVLFAVLLVGVCLQVFGSGKVKPSEWFSKADKPQVVQTMQDMSNTSRLSARALTTINKTQFPKAIPYVDSSTEQIYPVSYSYDYEHTVLNVSVSYSFNAEYLCFLQINDGTTEIVRDEGTVNSGSATHSFSISLKVYDTWGLDLSGGQTFSFYIGFFVYGYGNLLNQGISRPYAVSTVPCTFTIEKKEIVPLPETPIKEGHTFAGWYYDEAFTRPYDGAPIYADTALYAKMEINTYRVTYDTDGGTAVENATINWNTAAPMPESTRIGYNFVGWFRSDGTQYNGEGITEDMTLTAHWDIKTYTVTFYVDGEIYLEKIVEYGTVFTEIVEEASVQNLRVMSLCTDSGAPMTDIVAFSVTENVNVQAIPLTGIDKVKNTVKNNWLTIALSAVGLVALVCIISVLCSRKKKAYRR